ncbi:Uncharacterized conserved protein, DUF302 family [Ekhidna lutea]|uniref:Uncharacterized conserved protein, DUF302 family n=1 Tax=Ekhidna lutea TaxID=447679 RepID=A0A239LKR3_EKHLU|nr:DUF302 domain-containing protein [Ekhidna lutea]SNT30482.1 Uncharacterized conserved protein, DUF302 family [Ekhidna lutea]
MKQLLSAFALIVIVSANAQNLTTYLSNKSVDETVTRLVEIIKKKKLVYFETVEHDKVALDYGVEIPPTRMILFEDPNLMIELVSCRQTTALDLPMKILVWQEDEDVYIGFFDPKVMKKRFLLHECEDIITSMSRLKIRVVNEALKGD